MAEFTVRPADPDDVEGIRRVGHDGWHAAHDDIVGSDAVDEVLAEYYDPESVRAEITRDETIYRVAVADDDVVGFAVGVPHEEEPGPSVRSTSPPSGGTRASGRRSSTRSRPASGRRTANACDST